MTWEKSWKEFLNVLKLALGMLQRHIQLTSRERSYLNREHNEP